MITSLLFVVGTIIEFALVLGLKRAFEKECATSKEPNTNKTKIGITPIKVGDGMYPNDEQESETTLKDQKYKEESIVDQSNKWINFKITTNMIDFAAFFLFFLSYLIFNAYYWIYYFAQRGTLKK